MESNSYNAFLEFYHNIPPDLGLASWRAGIPTAATKHRSPRLRIGTNIAYAQEEHRTHRAVSTPGALLPSTPIDFDAALTENCRVRIHTTQQVMRY